MSEFGKKRYQFVKTDESQYRNYDTTSQYTYTTMPRNVTIIERTEKSCYINENTLAQYQINK